MIPEHLLKIRVPMEQSLLTQMEKMLNAHAICSLLSLSGQLNLPGESVSQEQAHAYPVSRRFGGEVFQTCKRALQTLGLEDLKVRFYIQASSDLNAEASYSFNAEIPHCITLSSGLLEKFSPQELSFVIGHEIGHLVFKHHTIRRVICQIYPNWEEIPPLLQITFDLWRKLGEISADRLGLLAVKDIKPALQAMFKLSAGVGMSFFEMDSDDYLAFTEKLVAKLPPASGSDLDTHPMDPTRVKALQLFYASRTFRNFQPGRSIKPDRELQGKMQSLMLILEKRPRSHEEFAEYEFLLQAGSRLIAADRQVTAAEYSYLANLLSVYCQYPESLINQALRRKRLTRSFVKSSAYIVRHSPRRCRALLDSLVLLMLRENRIDERELVRLLDIGTNHLRIPMPEVADMILQEVGSRFNRMA